MVSTTTSPTNLEFLKLSTWETADPSILRWRIANKHVGAAGLFMHIIEKHAEMPQLGLQCETLGLKGEKFAKAWYYARDNKTSLVQLILKSDAAMLRFVDAIK